MRKLHGFSARSLSVVAWTALAASCNSTVSNRPDGAAGSGAIGSTDADGTAGVDTATTGAGAGGTAGTGTSSGAAGAAGTKGTGTAGSGAAGSKGSGAAGTAAADAGAAGTGAAGTAAAGSKGSGAAGSTGAAGTAAPGTGAAGTSPTGAAGTGAPIDATQSVLTRNKRETRDGFFTQPTLTKAMAARMAPDAGFRAIFTGTMWASPLYVSNGPGGRGVFIAVATNNDVYALDETTGAVVWTRNIGTAPAQSGAGCGNIFPVGIISTPVIDGTRRTIYVAGAIGQATIQRHEIHALSVDDGSERAGWPVDVSTMKEPGGLAFPTVAQNQRPALSLVGGILYVAYGGHGGDCNAYHGWVIAVNTHNPTLTGAWATGGLGEAIWASGGMASDGNGVIATTGNRNVDGPFHQDSEEVVRVTGMGAVDRSTGIFFPASWRTMDQQDADFAANSPVVISLPGGAPSSLIATVSKDGHFYLLDAARFGGSTPLQDLVVATGGPMLIRGAPAAHPTPGGVRVIFNTQIGATCGSGRGVLSVVVSGASPTARLTWCAPTNGDSSPIATSPDGRNETVVWFASGTELRGVDGETGATITAGGGGSCSGIQKWTSPIAVKGRIVVGGDGHLCSWSPQ